MEAAMNSEVTVAVLLDFPLPTMTPFFLSSQRKDLFA